MKKKTGFTLIEVMLATMMMLVISALGIVAVQSSAKTINLNQSTTNVQMEARNLMLALTHEIEYAVKPAPVGGVELPLGVQGARVIDDGHAVVFQMPTDGSFTRFSAPITIRFVTEDVADTENGFDFGNAILDTDEDDDGNGSLTRRITRTQGGVTTTIGGANNIAFARFEMRDDNNTLRISLVTTARIEPGVSRLSRFDLQSDVYLLN